MAMILLLLAAALPPEAAILPGDQAAALLRQCSRAAPARGDATWRPGEAEIAALEAALAAALTARGGPGRPDWSHAPRGWLRQYVGIVRGGRRYIYGNFFRFAGEPPPNWTTRPMIVCDGGPNFFGVEYDVAARRFTHFAFNGPY